METLDFFTGTDYSKIQFHFFDKRSLTRSGMCLSTVQLYEMVMQGRSHTAIVDQPDNKLYDYDDKFAPDERELGTITQFVQQEHQRVRENYLELAKDKTSDTNNVSEQHSNVANQ